VARQPSLLRQLSLRGLQERQDSLRRRKTAARTTAARRRRQRRKSLTRGAEGAPAPAAASAAASAGDPKPVVYGRSTDECAVCMEKMGRPTVTPCGHCFCRACIDAVLATDGPARGKCPSCRAPVLPAQLRNRPPGTKLTMAVPIGRRNFGGAGLAAGAGAGAIAALAGADVEAGVFGIGGALGVSGGIESMTDAGQRLARREMGAVALSPEEYARWYTQRYMPDLEDFEDDAGARDADGNAVPPSCAEKAQLAAIDALLCCCVIQ